MSNDNDDKWGSIEFIPADDDGDLITKKLRVDKMRQENLTQRERKEGECMGGNKDDIISVLRVQTSNKGDMCDTAPKGCKCYPSHC